MVSDLDRAIQLLEQSDETVVLTGAGISTASGLPDFRGKNGVWDDYDPRTFTLDFLKDQPDAFWEGFLALQEDLFSEGPYDPNSAHEALADLAECGALSTIVTQNVDRLHEKAGTAPENVLHLHGRTDYTVCLDCGERFDSESVYDRIRSGESPPRCARCSGLLKPGGVLFGEQIPRDKHLRAHALAENCDLFLVAGSSLTVEPAASLPGTALRSGGDLIIVNLDPTPFCDRARVSFHEDVTKVLPALVRKLPSGSD